MEGLSIVWTGRSADRRQGSGHGTHLDLPTADDGRGSRLKIVEASQCTTGLLHLEAMHEHSLFNCNNYYFREFIEHPRQCDHPRDELFDSRWPNIERYRIARLIWLSTSRISSGIKRFEQFDEPFAGNLDISLLIVDNVDAVLLSGVR